MISTVRVSVVIPTRGRPRQLAAAISSVLRQSYIPVETIVVDDNGAGTDEQIETRNTIERFPGIVYCVNQSNLGQSASLNAGIRRSCGELIAFLDDDDEFHPDKIARQVARLQETGAAGAYCNYRRILRGQVYYRSAHKRGADEGDLALPMLLGTNEICGGSTLVVRRSVLDEIGGFDERFRRHVDWSFLVRFFRENGLCLCEEELVTIHMPEQLWKLDPQFLFDTKCQFFEVFRADIERHGPAARDICFKHWSDVYFQCLRAGNLRLAWRSLRLAIADGRFDVVRLLRLTASAWKHSD